MKKLKVLFAAVPIMIICVIVLSVYFTSSSFASVGAEFRENVINKEVPEFDQVEFEKYKTEVAKKDFWFTAPSDFTKNSLSRDDSKRLFVSKINSHDTPDEWKAMSVPERVAVSQIPDDILKSLPTEDLVMYCMNVNMMGDMYAFNNLKEGFERLVFRYNSLQELQNKKNSGSELLRLYKALDLYELSENDRFSTIRLSFLEMVLAQDHVLETLTEKEYNELVIECFNKAKQIDDKFSGHFSTSTTVYLGIKCLYKHDNNFVKIVNSSEGVANFIETSRLNLNDIDDEILGKIVVYFQNKYLEG